MPDGVDILFVGQSPGPEEDQEGLAFVGDAGLMLDKVRPSYLPKGTTWYITNATRCYPGKTPNNQFRKPNGKALAACEPYLAAEVAYLKPQIIVAMGKEAIQQVTGLPANKVKVGKMAGRVYPSRYHRTWEKGRLKGAVPVFVMHHPAWVTRNIPANLPLWTRVWENLRMLLDKGEINRDLPGKWAYLDQPGDIEEFYDTLLNRILNLKGEKLERLAIDYETTELDWYRPGARITMVSYGTADQSTVVKWIPDVCVERHKAVLRALKEVVFHNAPFDVTYGYGKMGVVPSGKILDTKFAAYLVNENMGMSLDEQVERWLPDWRGFKDESEDYGGPWSDMPELVLARRCAYDAMTTYRLWDIFWEQLAPETKWMYDEVIAPMVKTLCRMKVRGWQVDVKMLEDLRAISWAKAYAVRSRIENDHQITMHNNGVPLNPNAPLQVAMVLGRLGIKDRTRMPNNPKFISTAKDVLERHRKEHWLVDALLEFGRHIGHVERADHYLRFMSNGKLYPGYNWGGKARQDKAKATVTGRLSSAKPNLMNPPRLYRRCFISRHDGGCIVQADYSQLELRILASEANETRLLDVYRRKGDAHQESADMLAEQLGKPASPDPYWARQIGKRLNFGSVYGAGPETIWEQIQKDAITGTGKGVEITVEEVEQLWHAWWEGMPACHRYMQMVHMKAITEGEVMGIFGQVRHVPNAMSEDRRMRGHALRQLGNFPIQNGGAVITLKAMTDIDNELIRRKMRSMVIGQMHDSVIVDTHPDEVDEVKEIVLLKMRDEMNVWLKKKEFKIPLDVDLKVGYDLRESKPLKAAKGE